jgi:hypothetical protein
MISDAFEVVNSHTRDKNAAMDLIEADIKREGRNIRGMEFDHTDADGFHHYRVYTDKKIEAIVHQMKKSSKTPLAPDELEASCFVPDS